MAPFVFSESQEHFLDYALYISCGLSMMGTAFIIMTFILFPKTRTFGTKLIFFLSISDFMTSLSWFPWDFDYDFCLFQASILQFFMVASYFWSLAIAISLFQAFFLEKQEEPRKTIMIYHVLNWGYPLVTVILCLAFKKFGVVGNWCWISDPQDYFRLFVYVPMTLILVFICLNYIFIRLKMQGLQSNFKRVLLRKLSLYLLAFISSQLPAVVNGIQSFVNPNNPIFLLYLLQACLQPAQGLFNCFVYGFNEQAFVDQYKLVFDQLNIRKLFKCCNSCEKRMKKKKQGKQSTTTLEDIPIYDYDYHSDEEHQGLLASEPV